MSPVFKRQDGFTFKVFSNEEERMHIHVFSAENEAKFWLEPVVELAENFGFSSKEIRKLQKIIQDNGEYFKRQYIEHIGKRVDDK